MTLQDYHHEIMNELGEHVLIRDDVNAIDHKLSMPEEEGMIVGSIHICINQTQVRIYRVIKINENPKTVAVEIRNEIVKRLEKMAWEKLRRVNY